MAKTPDEIAAEEDAAKKHREELAKQANANRNKERVDRLGQIADNADRIKEEEDELEDMTDEAWARAQRQDQDEPPEKTEKRRVAKDEDEDATLEESESERAVRRQAERTDRDMDEAREAGADDIRKRDDGTVEYRLEKNGEVRWLTLSELREAAGEVPDEREDLTESEPRGRTAATRAPSPTEAERRAAAEAAKAARKAKLKDLLARVSMGDEAAIDELAELQAGISDVTSDNLQELVIQTVDARVEGKTSFDRAVEWFESEYREELASPRLKKMAARLDREYADEDPALNPKARLKKVGEELRSFRRELLGEQDTPGGRRNVDKQERKRQLSPVREASGRPRQESEPDEAGSVQDAIQNMARSRGQARAIKH
jgi:hypothetical protein